VFITLTGITALSGAKGLTLFAGAIGAITTASMLLPDPLIKAEEALKKLTSTQINRDIYQTLFAIRDLEVKNKELKESFDEIVKSGGLENNFKIDMDDITGSVMKYKDEIAKIMADNTHPYHKGDETAVEKVRQLHEKAYGN